MQVSLSRESTTERESRWTTYHLEVLGHDKRRSGRASREQERAEHDRARQAGVVVGDRGREGEVDWELARLGAFQPPSLTHGCRRWVYYGGLVCLDARSPR